MKFKAFIFDLDGTLTDSLTDLTESVNFALKAQNFELLSEDQVRQRLGHGMNRLVEDSLPEPFRKNDKIVGKTLELMAQRYSEIWKNNTCLYPEIATTLDSLMIKGVKLAILSNKPENFLKEIVSLLLSKWEFRCIIGGRNDFPLKPNPKSTLHIIKELNLNPDEVAFVGDGDTDVQTAIAAGIQPIAVTWGLRSVEELTQAGANIFIDSPTQLLDYV